MVTSEPLKLNRSAAPQRIPATRMQSLDALRGFAMFWLIGGQGLVLALAAYAQWPWLQNFADELHHPDWDGFVWWDLVMPLFMFVSGVTIPLSITRKLKLGESRWRLYRRLLRRVCLLMLLNFIGYGALRHLNWHEMRYTGVLARIGVAYFFAALIVMHTSPRRQFLWVTGILLGYWAAMALIPVPDIGAGVFTKEGHLAGYIDRHLQPGIILGGLYDRLGWFSNITATVTVLLGALAGNWLCTQSRRGLAKAAGLLVVGVVMWAVAQLWVLVLPFNTKFWSPTYVLVAGGWSLILLALFYLVIDVWQCRRWAFFFVVIGLNPITVYFIRYPVDFFPITQYFCEGAIALAAEAVQPVLWAACTLGIVWLAPYFLYRHKIVLRV